MNALRHGLSYVGCDLIESKDSPHEDVDAYFDSKPYRKACSEFGMNDLEW